MIQRFIQWFFASDPRWDVQADAFMKGHRIL
jgi:hypothetical protein